MTEQLPTSARNIYEQAPLGAVIRFSDGTPRPPGRFKRKLQSWENANGTGRLTEKTPGSERFPATFTLHIGDINGRSGVKLVQFFRTYSVNSPGIFTIESLPAPEKAAA